MDDLIAWLRAQLDEDEALARACRGESWVIDGDFVFGADSADQIWFGGTHPSYPEVGDHIARHDPARVLAEVEAKRRILDWLDMAEDWMFDKSYGGQPDCDTVRGLLALPYADRPGYRDEWRP